MAGINKVPRGLKILEGRGEFTQVAELLKKKLEKLQGKQAKELKRHQVFALDLIEKFRVPKKDQALFFRLAKYLPEGILERAWQYVSDASVTNRIGLFLWKVKNLYADYKDRKKKDK